MNQIALPFDPVPVQPRLKNRSQRHEWSAEKAFDHGIRNVLCGDGKRREMPATIAGLEQMKRRYTQPGQTPATQGRVAVISDKTVSLHWEADELEIPIPYYED